MCPQVGGYLAFIGLFCLEAGLTIASGKDVEGINTWGALLNQRYHTSTEAVIRCGHPFVWCCRSCFTAAAPTALELMIVRRIRFSCIVEFSCGGLWVLLILAQ